MATSNDPGSPQSLFSLRSVTSSRLSIRNSFVGGGGGGAGGSGSAGGAPSRSEGLFSSTSGFGSPTFASFTGGSSGGSSQTPGAGSGPGVGGTPHLGDSFWSEYAAGVYFLRRRMLRRPDIPRARAQFLRVLLGSDHPTGRPADAPHPFDLRAAWESEYPMLAGLACLSLARASTDHLPDPVPILAAANRFALAHRDASAAPLGSSSAGLAAGPGRSCTGSQATTLGPDALDACDLYLLAAYLFARRQAVYLAVYCHTMCADLIERSGQSALAGDHYAVALRLLLLPCYLHRAASLPSLFNFHQKSLPPFDVTRLSSPFRALAGRLAARRAWLLAANFTGTSTGCTCAGCPCCVCGPAGLGGLAGQAVSPATSLVPRQCLAPGDFVSAPVATVGALLDVVPVGLVAGFFREANFSEEARAALLFALYDACLVHGPGPAGTSWLARFTVARRLLGATGHTSIRSIIQGHQAGQPPELLPHPAGPDAPARDEYSMFSLTPSVEALYSPMIPTTPPEVAAALRTLWFDLGLADSDWFLGGPAVAHAGLSSEDVIARQQAFDFGSPLGPLLRLCCPADCATLLSQSGLFPEETLPSSRMASDLADAFAPLGGRAPGFVLQTMSPSGGCPSVWASLARALYAVVAVCSHLDSE
ncbi:hypothetical protein H696_04576 [Fonticula alba]|uniref:Uncharacterized protein n=1 Tax=Fonticula alba TaxID=691883 RepID=A0A058Z6K3_FONAL|nr:hypothetical protein H696_04576 [Fonticula alba]KCV69162.1 hypothetical protein H696_04576 [Fonticula alba]|eukprot:XP_009496733.1 hypothetical protein H696_04576 [Fonticula alba]